MYIDWKNGYILWLFEMFYGHLGYFMTLLMLIWYIFVRFCIKDEEKSGNPDPGYY
jgi:hypothetical protein